MYGKLSSVIVACVIAVVPGLVFAVEQAPNAIPIEAFVLESQYRNPKLSPDGEHLLITVRTHIDGREVPIMTIYNLKQGSIRARVQMPAFQVPLDYEWVSNTRLVVEKGREIGSLESPVPTGEILAMDVDGTKQDYLNGHDMFQQSSRGGVNQDDEGWGFVQSLPTERNGRFFLREYQWARDHERSRLLDVNANNAARRVAAEIPVADMRFLLHRNGEPRFAFGGDVERKYVFFRRVGAKGDWQQVSTDELGGGLWPLAFAANDKDVIAQFSADRGPLALVRQGIDGQGRNVIAAHATGSIDVIEWTGRSRVPFAAATRVGIPALKYDDESSAETQLHKGVAAQFPGQYVHFVNFSDDGNLLLFGTSSDRDPGAFYLLDRSKGKAQALFAVAPAIDPARMAERRPIAFAARDGLELHGYLTLPPGLAPKALRLVLLPHGGPHGVADEWFFDNDAQFLASRGYAVLQVNYRGSAGRGDKFRESGFKQWGGKIQDDLIDAVKWAAAQGFADARRVCSFGASFGAYSALMVAVRAPGLLRCAIGYAGVYDLPYIYEEERTRLNKRIQNYYARVIGVDRAELAAHSPTRLAQQVKIPVLLVHGEEDKTAPPEHARLMRDALAKSGNPPEWMMVANEAHGFYAIKNRVAFYKRLEGFLSRHLAP